MKTFITILTEIIIILSLLSCTSQEIRPPSWVPKEKVEIFSQTVKHSTEYLATVDSIAKILKNSQDCLRQSLDSIDVDPSNKLKLIRANELAIKQLEIAVISLYIPKQIMTRITKEEIEEILKKD